MTPGRRAALVSVVLAGFGSEASADRGEWRLGAQGAALLTEVSSAGIDATAIGFGGRLRFGYGVLNPLEVAVAAGYAHASTFEFQAAMLGSQRGTLFADLDAIEASFEVRWTLGVELWRLFERTQPFLAARGGALLVRFSGQVLVNDKAMIVEEPDDSLELRPFVGGTVGVQHRFGDHLTIALLGDVALADDYRHVGANLELGWSWY